jgi:formylglycine-generating enzyme required for sulfatase activity
MASKPTLQSPREKGKRPEPQHSGDTSHWAYTKARPLPWGWRRPLVAGAAVFVGLGLLIGLLWVSSWQKDRQPPSSQGNMAKVDPPKDPAKENNQKQAAQEAKAGEGGKALPAPKEDGPGPPPSVAKEVTNSIGMKLVLIPAGKFQMGSPKEEKDRSDDEEQHEVEITRPFYMGVYPVTQQEYEKVMGKNPSGFCRTGGGKDKVANLDTSRFPVERVSWQDAREFCKKLSELAEEKHSGRIYRLPTEAEWEYACRAGTESPFYFGRSLSSEQANFDGNYPYGSAAKGPCLGRTTTVGSYKPNAFGLYDMHGNVWQWCQDWFDTDYYRRSPKTDPLNDKVGSGRVLRGGGWYYAGVHCRSAYRCRLDLDDRGGTFGFRVAAVPPVGAESGK